MNSSRGKKECNTCMSVSACTILGFMFMGLIFQSIFVMFEHYETVCYIVRTETPHNLPTSSNNDGWTTCRCGKRCQSYTPCSKIYVNISEGNTNVLMLESTMVDMRTNSICTFSQERCYRQQVWEQNASMYKSIQKMESYYELANTSTPIRCYTNEERTEAYLENDIPLLTILLFTIPFCLSLLWCSIVTYPFFKDTCCPPKIYPICRKSNDNYQKTNDIELGKV